MNPMTTDQLRQTYVEFFQGYGHAQIPGAPLIPENDPSVLFTTAGMHPLVPYLLGEPHPAGQRLTNVQRCIRTQDIDEVGDASHLTFFEMLGNWSLGDYFKQDAISMSFEFLTKVLGIPAGKLAVTCFEGDADAPRDQESAEIWMRLGIPPERIAFLPKADNWWGPAGQSGPCGPDTEMFYWVGAGAPQGNPGTHKKEWLEIWNDVFLQYDKKLDGTFAPLRQRNVDTGMGLERVAAVLQGVASVYETDRLSPILRKVSAASGGPRHDQVRHTRIVTDHLRAAAFIMADGIGPSNVDQGYVLRRLIRRAIRSARGLGVSEAGPFLRDIVCSVISQYSEFYPHLVARQAEILDALAREEQQFSRTLQEGLKQFEKAAGSASGAIDGLSAFRLYDTFGFPLELTREMALERGLAVEEEAFHRAFKAHQAKSRTGAEKRFSGGLADQGSQTTKLHSATHLLNAALRRVLGDHVFQKGSNITPERLRFDFSHPARMTAEEVQKVADLVNSAIRADLPIRYHMTTVEAARSEGAIGVFDDRYAAEVKVYVIGDAAAGTVFSREICGGPHVARTGLLGDFRIQKEESSSAGVRRIKATLSGDPDQVEIAQEQEGSAKPGS